MPTIGISIRADLQGLDLVVKRLNKPWSKVSTRLVRAMNEVLSELEHETKETASTVLNIRSGRLRDSIKSTKAMVHDGYLEGGVASSGIPYNRAQEYGATITPKTAQFLTIPVGPAKDQGVTARQVIDDPSVLGFTGTFFRHQILFGTPGPEPLFILKEQVILPERSYMRSTMKRYQPTARERMHEALVEILKE